MELALAIKKAIKLFGEKIVTEKRFVSILCDYHAFDNNPSAKHILSNAILLGYLERLLIAKNNQAKKTLIISDFSNRTGFRHDLVSSLFSQITESIVLSEAHQSSKRRQVPIIFIVDSSEKMVGGMESCINDIMENVLSFISDLDKRDPYYEAKITSIVYGDTAVWSDLVPKSADDYIWKGIVAQGNSNIGKAFSLLKEEFWLVFNGKIADPIFILLSGSKATDDYKPILNNLLSFYELKYSTKIGISIGGNADMELLNNFAGTKDTIISVRDIEKLKSILVYNYSYPELPASDEPSTFKSLVKK